MSTFTLTRSESDLFNTLRATTGEEEFDALVTEGFAEVGIDPYSTSGYTDADKLYLLATAGRDNDFTTLTQQDIDLQLESESLTFPFSKGNYILGDQGEETFNDPITQNFIDELSDADGRAGYSVVDNVWLYEKHGNITSLWGESDELTTIDIILYNLAELNDVFGLTDQDVTAFNNRLSKLGLGDSTTLTPEKIGELQKIAELDGEAGLSDRDVELYHLANLNFVIAHAGHWVDWFRRALNQS